MRPASLNLPSLSAIAGVIGSYFAVFQSHLAADTKSAIGSAALALIGWWNHEHQSTKRNETTASASLGKAPDTGAPSVEAITAHVLKSLGGPGGPTAGPSTS